MNLFLNSAFAQEATKTTSAVEAVNASAPAPAASGLVSILPFILIFVIFYFMLIRPQVKKQKAHVSMLDNLKRGDKVVTTGGIIGNIVKIDDNIINLEIAPEIRIRIVKNSITEIFADQDNKITQKQKD